MDLRELIARFQDHLAPKLDTYEQAIYRYVFRHSRLLGLERVTFGFKSARSRLARGTGEKGKPMSLRTAYAKLASLQARGCIDILRTTDAGHEFRASYSIGNSRPYHCSRHDIGAQKTGKRKPQK